jgi:hypothetical protein
MATKAAASVAVFIFLDTMGNIVYRKSYAEMQGMWS